jgi:hypothetical protein
MELIPGEWCGFPYAVRLAEERGATLVLIQPRITDKSLIEDGKEYEIRPDVFAVMPSGPPLIIEVEDSTGQKFKKDGPGDRESRLRDNAKFLFILGPNAKGCKKRLGEYFAASVELLDLSDPEKRFGQLGIGSKSISFASLPVGP